MMFAKRTMVSESDYDRMVEESNLKGEKIPKKSFKNVRVFNYSLLNETFVPGDGDIIRIYSLLGKKFHLHDVRFFIAPNEISISDSGVAGHIRRILDYGDSKYYVVDVDGQELIVLDQDNNKAVDDLVNLHINDEKIGVYDVNFGVKLL